MAPRLVFVTGKGGVGKTTIAASLAAHAARTGQRVALIDLHGDSIAGLFRKTRCQYAGTRLAPRLTGFAITPREAFKEFASQQLGSPRLYRTFFDNRFVHYFLDATPGLNEVVCLGKIWHLATTDAWDRVIVDLPATGHGIDFLDVPRIVTDVVHRGPLKTRGTAIRETLQDARVTSVLIVSRCEELPVNEALELQCRILQLGMHCGGAIANRVLPQPIPGDAAATWATLQRAHHQDTAWAPYLHATTFLQQCWERQGVQLKRLQTAFGTQLQSCREQELSRDLADLDGVSVFI